MSGYTNPKCKKYYQLAQNFSVHLQTKNQLQPPCFSGDIAKICTLLILSTLGMPGCKHPKWCYQLVEDFHVYLHAKNKLHHSLFFLRYYILNNPTISLADIILAHTSITRILPDMGLIRKYQQQY